MGAYLPIVVAAAMSVSHTKIDVKKTETLGPCISQVLTFEITPPRGEKINKDAPWVLELDGAQVPGSPDFTLNPPAFVVESRCGVIPSGSGIKYKITAFSCTLDGKRCTRDVISGNL